MATSDGMSVLVRAIAAPQSENGAPKYHIVANKAVFVDRRKATETIKEDATTATLGHQGAKPIDCPETDWKFVGIAVTDVCTSDECPGARVFTLVMFGACCVLTSGDTLTGHLGSQVYTTGGDIVSADVGSAIGVLIEGSRYAETARIFITAQSLV